MIRIVFLSDTHLGQDYPIRPRINRPRRGEDFFNNFEKVLAYAIEQKADMVIHGGDLFFRARIPELIVNKVYKILYEFSRHDIPFAIVPGNHERSRFPRSPLLNQPGIYIFNYPRTFVFEIKGLRMGITGFPYHYEHVRDSFQNIVCEANSEKPETDLHFLLTHHAVEGCNCGPGTYIFRHHKDVIQMNDIPEQFDAVLCGHIHREQILIRKTGDKEIPVVYCGSTERTSFAEIDEIKGFYQILIDEGSKKIKTFDFVTLPARPMFDLKIEETFESSERLEDHIAQKLKQIPKGTIVRIGIKNDHNRELLKQKSISEKFNEDYFIQFSGLKPYGTKPKKKDRFMKLFDL